MSLSRKSNDFSRPQRQVRTGTALARVMSKAEEMKGNRLMVSVRHAAPDQRMNHRVTAPIWVDTPDGTYRALDWSVGGIGIEQYRGAVAVGDALACALCIPFQGFDICFDVDLEVRHIDEIGRMGGAFVNLGERERGLLFHFVGGLVQGEMTSIDDTILRIDIPVTPVSTEPDINPKDQMPLRRWRLKTLFFSAFYFTLGAAVLIYMGLVVFTNFWRLEVNTAVIHAPIQAIYATSDGRIINAAQPSEKRLEPNTPLFYIADPKLIHTIDVAKITIVRALANLSSKRQDYDTALLLDSDLRLIARGQNDMDHIAVSSLGAQVELARVQLDRLENLYHNRWTEPSTLYRVEQEYTRLSEAYEKAVVNTQMRDFLIEGQRRGHYFLGDKLYGTLGKTRSEQELAWKQVQLARDELFALERKRVRLVIVSPAPGRLLKVLKPAGTFVKRGDKIGLYERDEARTIWAYLTQEEVLKIGLGDEAMVYFPALKKRVAVTVFEIDRTSGFVNEMQSNTKRRGPSERSALVKLQFTDAADEDLRRTLKPGLPAIIIFKRDRTFRGVELKKNGRIWPKKTLPPDVRNARLKDR